MKTILGVIFLSLLLSGAAYAKKVHDANEDGILITECVFSWGGCYRQVAKHCAQYNKFFVHIYNHQAEKDFTVRLYCITEDPGEFFYDPVLKKKVQVDTTNFDPNSPWATNTTQSNTVSSSSSSSSMSMKDKITQAKQICTDLGFQQKTEKHADCSMQMMSIQFETTNKVASASGGTTQEVIVTHRNDYDIWDALLDFSAAIDPKNKTTTSSSSSNRGTNCVVGRTNPTFGTTTINCN